MFCVLENVFSFFCVFCVFLCFVFLGVFSVFWVSSSLERWTSAVAHVGSGGAKPGDAIGAFWLFFEGCSVCLFEEKP